MSTKKKAKDNRENGDKNAITNDLGALQVLEGLFQKDEQLFEELAEDMSRHGFDSAHPIVVWKGRKKIVDGDHRDRAAKVAKVHPIVVEKEFKTEDEAICYKLHHQVNRRNLSPREIWEIIQRFGKNRVGRPKKKLRPSGSISDLTDKKLSRMTGLSVRRIRRLRAVNKLGSEELRAEVFSGKKSISGAEQEVRGRSGNGNPAEQGQTQGQEREKRLEIIYGDIDKIRPNTFNPNEMTPNRYKALKKNIAKIGDVQPLLCRRISDPDYEFQIIDGEHRFTAEKELGHKEVPIIIIDMDEQEAKMQCLLMNRLRGRARESKLAPLANELKGKVKDFRKRTGWNANRIQCLTTMCNTQVAEEYVPGKKSPLKLERGVPFEKTIINCIVFFSTIEDRKFCEGVLRRINKKNAGIALKMLCEAYEAGKLRMGEDASSLPNQDGNAEA